MALWLRVARTGSERHAAACQGAQFNRAQFNRAQFNRARFNRAQVNRDRRSRPARQPSTGDARWLPWGGRRVGRLLSAVVLAGSFLVGSLLVACGGGGASAFGRDVRVGAVSGERGAIVTQAELQQDVERFVSEFMFDVAHAMRSVEESPETRLRALGHRRTLIYYATSLDIASGPYPELNVVDMLVFVALARGALEEYWIPTEFGARGRPLLDAFTRAEERMWHVSGKILSGEQQEAVRELIADWRRLHPGVFVVEGVRFEQFAYRAGEVAEERARRARGLFGQIRSATRTADEALLLGERAVFLSHRLPFLLRLQARVGTEEILLDSLANVQDVLRQVPELRPLLDELTVLTSHAGSAAHEARLLAEASVPLLDRLVGPSVALAPGSSQNGRAANAAPADVLGRLDDITRRSESMLRELRSLLPADPEALGRAVEHRVESTARRIAIYCLIVGLGWAVFFWTGYYLVKR